MNRQIRSLYTAIFLYSLLIFTQSGFAQEKNDPAKNYNVFRMYYSPDPFPGKKNSGVKEEDKFDEPDMFVQFEHDIRTRDGKSGPEYSPNYLMEAFNKSQAQKRLYKTNSLNWIERGPGNVSGRTRGIIVDPVDPTHKTWFAGSVSGGIWKTTNAGLNWSNQTASLPNLATTVLAQASSNPDIIYCGTGEGFSNADAVNGAGIFKSIDHGNTWAQLTSTTSYEFRNINRIIIDPGNADILLACTNQGTVKRSTDGGTTWSSGIFLNTIFNKVQDLKADPTNFSIQYCTVNGDGVYKSTDGGVNWIKSGAGLTTSGRIEIAVSPSNPNYIYASCQKSGDASGLYVSEDKGATWLAVTLSDGTTPNWLKAQGWYDNTIAVHPYDEKTVFFGGIDLWKAQITSSAGTTRTATFSHVTDGYGAYQSQSPRPATNVHVDHHNLSIVPVSSPSTFWIVNGNDGGVAYSTNGGSTWQNTLNGGYNTTQFYGVDKRPGSNQYIGGMQDNGTWFSPAGQNASAITSYNRALDGDGFDVSWHYKEPNKIIGGSQYNSFYRTTDGGATWQNSTSGLDDVGSGKGVFMSKIAKSNSDPDIIYTTGISGVWRSEDFGATWSLSTITGSVAWGYGRTSTPAAVSIANPQIVWAGYYLTNSSLTKLFLSSDGGVTFSGITSYPASSLGSITGIDTHPTEKNTAYITFSFYNSPKILRTTDLGNSWQDITGFSSSSTSSGFPNVATYCVLVMPYNTNIIWAGTEIGLFESTDNGISWHATNNGLPSVCIWDMQIVDDQVVLATHGRGIFSVSLPELSSYQPPVVTLSPVITGLAQGVDKAINITANLRSSYDSTIVAIDGQRALKMVSNSAAKDTLLKFSPAVFGTVKIQLISYKEGTGYKSSLRSLDVYDLPPTQVKYENKFEAPTSDFANSGFNVSIPAGFVTYSVNSPHPYVESVNYYYTLLVPIKISWSPGLANIEYDDIALIEPGETNVPFGDPYFYDYVVVEGSRDGLNWIPFQDGYDCRYNSTWNSLFNSNTDPTSLNYLHHKISMTPKFNPGEVIFVRFHLFSDEGAVGWGWIFDNLNIQPGASAVENETELPVNYSLSQNYPNPFNPETTIKFSLPQRSKVKLEIIDILGRVVSTIVNSELDAGSYNYKWNGSNYASGVYVYKLTANEFTSVKKLMLVK